MIYYKKNKHAFKRSTDLNKKNVLTNSAHQLACLHLNNVPEFIKFDIERSVRVSNKVDHFSIAKHFFFVCHTSNFFTANRPVRKLNVSNTIIFVTTNYCIL